MSSDYACVPQKLCAEPGVATGRRKQGPSQTKNGLFWYQELVQIRYAASTADLIVIDGRR